MHRFPNLLPTRDSKFFPDGARRFLAVAAADYISKRRLPPRFSRIWAEYDRLRPGNFAHCTDAKRQGETADGRFLLNAVEQSERVLVMFVFLSRRRAEIFEQLLAGLIGFVAVQKRECVIIVERCWKIDSDAF